MRKILALLMLTLSLTACATTSSRPLTEADLALRRINEERIRNAQPKTPPPPTAQEVIGAIIAAPIVIPLAAMVEYGRGPYSSSVHCRSWTYKDQYHASCY